MGNNPHAQANLRPFKKGNPGGPGRPAKFVTTLKKEGYKLSEIMDTIEKMMAMTEGELVEIGSHREFTVMERTIANALRKGMISGSLDSIETLISRVYRKPVQPIAGPGSGILVPSMTEEAIDARIAELEAKFMLKSPFRATRGGGPSNS